MTLLKVMVSNVETAAKPGLATRSLRKIFRSKLVLDYSTTAASFHLLFTFAKYIETCSLLYRT